MKLKKRCSFCNGTGFLHADFAGRLTDLLDSHMMSASNLATVIGSNVEHVREMQNGTVLPTVQQLMKMAEQFSVSTDYLLALRS